MSSPYFDDPSVIVVINSDAYSWELGSDIRTSIYLIKGSEKHDSEAYELYFIPEIKAYQATFLQPYD